MPEFFDLTPDPKVLIALTHTPLQPLDALSELIDNGLDSFQIAKLQGQPCEHPLVLVELPGPAEVTQGKGIIRVRDNGPGLSLEMAERALKAGFTSQNPYDSLGLFGMGFNISTGKLGCKTRFLTARPQDEQAIEVVVDLVKMQESGCYQVPVNTIDKPQDFDQGTIVEVSGWWPQGNPNQGFLRKLIGYGRPTIRRELGRRYATILQNQEIRILVNGEPCRAFEHCIWADNRYVERRGSGKIYAVHRFDEVIGNQSRCTRCNARVPAGDNSCPACDSMSLRTIEERIRGWLGIQRFDHPTDYGVDMIRNGRAIRIFEKAAFFEFTDEFKKIIKDYPVDSPFGRIVGEVHLNHVPVDFMKQDFQRSSEEWTRAMSYLRGDSSLQPKQPGADDNKSPTFMLYQGYRRVRDPGKRDLYMGYWDRELGRARRIDRETEREYYNKFLEHNPGFYEDMEWWKLVEQADTQPLEELVECPGCTAQNLKENDVCQVCSHVLIGQACTNDQCEQIIPRSAAVCPHCGTSQIPEVEEPWNCEVCSSQNQPETEHCQRCGSQRGARNPVSLEYLRENADREEGLSIPACSILLADGSHSTPIDVVTYAVRDRMRPDAQGDPLPALSFKSDKIEIFIDTVHPLFRHYRSTPEQMVAAEVALYLHDTNRRLAGSEHHGKHTLSNITWGVLKARWSDSLPDTTAGTRDEIQQLFTEIRSRLAELKCDNYAEMFDELTEQQQKLLVDNLLRYGRDIGELAQMKASGEFLRFVDESAILDLYRKFSPIFFDGAVWRMAYANMPEIGTSAVRGVQDRIRIAYLNCLEECVLFIQDSTLQAEQTLVRRARETVAFLRKNLE